MRNYERIIKKEGKDPKFYLPIINLFYKYKKPLSIKEVAKFLGISYLAAKSRLHKLVKWGVIKGMKRGYYCTLSFISNYTNNSTSLGKLIFLNGSMRIMGSSNGVWVSIYNSKFADSTSGMYCKIVKAYRNNIIIKKTNAYEGNKLCPLTSRGSSFSISRKLIPFQLRRELSFKTHPIKIGIYLDEWSLSIKELFSTESIEEGELAEELDKFGELGKKRKFDDMKADILFIKNNHQIPIEITNTNPSSTGRFKQNKRSGIKSSLILERLYFLIKWNLINKSPTVLIINRDWLKFNWIVKEQEFMKRFNCHIIFTNFKGNWAQISALEINRLIK